MALALYKDLCIDAADPHTLGEFWAPLLGWTLNLHDDGDADLRDGDGDMARVHVWLNRVPEPKTVKNRLHLDVNVSSPLDAVSRGATLVDDTQRWTVLANVDGQEFCVFARDPLEERPYELIWDVTGDASAPRRSTGTPGAGSRTSRGRRGRRSCSCRCPRPRRPRTASTST